MGIKKVLALMKASLTDITVAEAGARAIMEIAGSGSASRDACFKAGAIPVLTAVATIHPNHLGVRRYVSKIVQSAKHPNTACYQLFTGIH